MATNDMKALLERMVADPNTPPAQKKKAQDQLRALGDGAGATAAPGARELMTHYQRQIAADPDYEESKNPGSRNPKYEPYPEGQRPSMKRPANTEIESMERRHGGPEGMKAKFPTITKQRSTKNNPVPRGTVPRNPTEKTRQELEMLQRMMFEGLIPSR